MSDIPLVIRLQTYARDSYRCRYCGVTNAYGYDCHHIEYRSSGGQHVLENLITLCRACHERVHSNKEFYQPILQDLVQLPGSATGMALERRLVQNTDERTIVLNDQERSAVVRRRFSAPE